MCNIIENNILGWSLLDLEPNRSNIRQGTRVSLCFGWFNLTQVSSLLTQGLLSLCKIRTSYQQHQELAPAWEVGFPLSRWFLTKFYTSADSRQVLTLVYFLLFIQECIKSPWKCPRSLRRGLNRHTPIHTLRRRKGKTETPHGQDDALWLTVWRIWPSIYPAHPNRTPRVLWKSRLLILNPAATLKTRTENGTCTDTAENMNLDF